MFNSKYYPQKEAFIDHAAEPNNTTTQVCPL